MLRCNAVGRARHGQVTTALERTAKAGVMMAEINRVMVPPTSSANNSTRIIDKLQGGGARGLSAGILAALQEQAEGWPTRVTASKLLQSKTSTGPKIRAIHKYRKEQAARDAAAVVCVS
jgi:hypothetical protein